MLHLLVAQVPEELPLFYINNSQIFILKWTGYQFRLLKHDSIQHENLLLGSDSKKIN